jgi:tetratricopeptide (TPR) repeat protein
METPSAEPEIAVDLALRGAGKGGKASAESDSYLRKQEKLLDLQLKHFERRERLQSADLGLKVLFQVSFVLIGLAVAIGIGAALRSAAHSSSVVVDAFSAPPDMAAKGLGGEVLASKLLDDLTILQSQTRSASSKRGLKDAWSGDIKVEVPQTGVSIGEVMRALRGWLGHETHVGGDLEETSSGVSLTVRGDGILPKSFTGTADDLPKLMTQAAEYAYGQSEPSLFAAYLQNVGRDADSLAFIQKVYAGARPSERPYLLNAWGNGLGDVGRQNESLPKYQEALRLKPDYWVAYNNVINALQDYGDEEGAWRVGEAMKAKAGGRPGRAPELYYQNIDQMVWNLQALRASNIADMEAHGGVGSGTSQLGPILADNAARLHDAQGAELSLQTSQGANKDVNTIAMTHFVHGYLALENGDFSRAASEMEAFGVSFANPVISTNYPGFNCWIAPAEEMAGHPDKADAALKAGGHFVDCWRFRGDILDHRGDWAGAQKAYAAAVGLAPDLPAAWYSWGLALARHGQLAAAQAKFAAANQRGPHWADPLKAWGDALAAQGRWKEAESKYDQALAYAPAWSALRAARARTLAKTKQA